MAAFSRTVSGRRGRRGTMGLSSIHRGHAPQLQRVISLANARQIQTATPHENARRNTAKLCGTPVEGFSLPSNSSEM